MKILVLSLVTSGSLVYAFILVMDPYQSELVSPSMPRAPVAQNQRYSYPALARNVGFDSAVVGTSTVRLLKPARLNTLLGARFVNLAMNDATPFEQVLMTRLFLQHHPRAKFLIFGVDDSWCRESESVRVETIRGLPEFMYDANQWNDLLYLFNDKALENSVRMLELVRGKREPKYGLDGYEDFSDDPEDRRLSLVRERIYGASAAVLPASPVNLEPARVRPGVRMAEMDQFADLLSGIPAGTRITVLFPPRHIWAMSQNPGLYQECKWRARSVVKTLRPDAVILDLLLDSAITREDSNYHDRIHYVDEVAEKVELAIARTTEKKRRGGSYWEVR